MNENGWKVLDVDCHEDVAPMTVPHWIYNPVTAEVGVAVWQPGASTLSRSDAGGRRVVPSDGFVWSKSVLGAQGPLPQRKLWKNPLPVVVMVVPTSEGVTLVRRADAATHGKIALPGGIQEEGETWQEAGCREVFEETGIVLDPLKVRILDVDTVEAGRVNLIYGLYDAIAPAGPFKPQEAEILEVITTDRAVELAFPSHTAVLARYFAQAA